MDGPLVSMCISVYNGEKDIGKCLDSVLSQQFDDMEMILVDDGSTDRTLQIMQEYKEKFPEKQIHVIEQEHGGLAQGRLTGVKHASGEYVTFLDADDYLLDGAYKTIVEFMQGTQADIYEFQSVRDDGRPIKSPYTGVMDAKKVLTDYFNGVRIPVNYWIRWYRRELFTESVFPVGNSLFEDTYAFPCILHRAKTIAYIDKPLHIYIINGSSITGKHYAKRREREYFEKQKILLLAIPHVASNIGQDVIDREYQEPFRNYTVRIYLHFLLTDTKGVSYDEKLDAIIETLHLDMSRKELERFISKNVPLIRKVNRVIRRLGLRRAYRVYRVQMAVTRLFRR